MQASLLLPPYHIQEINVSSIHVPDLTSSQESLCLIVCRSRATAAATSWIMMVDCESEIVILMAHPVSCWLIVIVMADPVSCWQLIVDSGGWPWSRWILMAAVDRDNGLLTMVATDHDGGSWWLLIMNYDYNKTAWHTICLLRYSIIADNVF